MQVSVEKLPKSEIKLTIIITDDELASYREKAAVSLSKKVNVPGFRGGNAPAFAIEGQVGKEAFFQEVLRFAIPQSFTLAAKQEKLELIVTPRINIRSQYPLTFEALSATLPQITVKGYEKAKPKKRGSAQISEKELEDVLREMLKLHAAYKPREGGAKKGDRVEIDFQGYDSGGAAIENTKSKQHPLFIGEGTLVPAFEEQLVGMNIGEKKKFPIIFPKDFHHAPFRGKEVHFDVSMTKAEEVTFPSLDDAFIEKITGQKSPAAVFKEQVKADLMREKQIETRKQQEAELIEAWFDKASVEVPPVLIEEEIDYLIEDMAREMQSRGVPLQKFMEYLEKQKKNLREEKRKEAERRVKARLVLNEILRLENIQVTEAEFNQMLESIISTYPPEEHDKIRQAYKNDPSRKAQLINTLRLKKLFDKFLLNP